MWRMSSGSRVLTAAEWALFSIGTDLLWDSIEDGIRCEMDSEETGVTVFDELTSEQKISLLADTVLALRDPMIPMPAHTAANEGAIASVFTMIQSELESELYAARTETEIDEKDPTEIRRLLRAIGKELREREEPLPNETCVDADEWSGLLEDFMLRIFWDLDYELGEEFLDLPPDKARRKMELYGIDPDYYLTVPNEPDRNRLLAARKTLARLLRRPVQD